jgi:hypothetical protein
MYDTLIILPPLANSREATIEPVTTALAVLVKKFNFTYR